MRTTHLRTLATLVLAGMAAACGDTPIESRGGAESVGAGAAPLFAASQGNGIPDRYIVVFRENVADAPGLARQLVTAHGGKLHHTYRHALRGFAATLPALAVEALRRNPQVKYVEQDGIASTSTTQSWAPWGLDRIDQANLPLGSTYTYRPWRTGAGVRIYVIDTGIRFDHAQFGGRAVAGFDALGGTGQDCNGHGTHVAGTAAGSTYGVAKQATVVSVRVLGCTGGSPWSTVIAGVDWVTANHVKPAVANMSLGGPPSTAADDAVNNSIAAGVAYAIAAGNDYRFDACNVSPARVGAALTVGATNSSDAGADFTNIGSCVDLFAPGVAIPSAWHTGPTATHTIDGTSMATPHVAGVAAQYLEGDPAATPSTVSSVILGAAFENKLSNVGTGSPNRLLNALPTPFVELICGYHTEYNWWCEAYAMGGSGEGYGFTWSDDVGRGSFEGYSDAIVHCWNSEWMTIQVSITESRSASANVSLNVPCPPPSQFDSYSAASP